MAAEVRIVLTTAPDAGVAETLARALVEEGLAACVNLVPGVVSIYRWEGEVQREGEVLLVAKTTSARVPDLIARLTELHPYRIPEALALVVEAGHTPYLDWVRGELRPR